MATHRLHDENGNFYLRKDNEGNFFVNTDSVTPPTSTPTPTVTVTPTVTSTPQPPTPSPTPSQSPPPFFDNLEAGYYCIGSPTDVESFCHDPVCAYHEGGDLYTYCNTVNGPYASLAECEAACSGSTPTPSATLTVTPTVTSTPTGT